MKKENMNNKGFSLVELIIVIAIMAVLVVVLAPQYLKYVERSRNSTDLQNATAVVTACQVYAADPEATKAFTAGEDFTITVTNADATIDGTNKDAAIAALQDAGIITTVDANSKTTELKCKSKTKWKEFTMTGKVDTNGGLTFTYTSKTDGSTATDVFQKAMNGDTETSNSESN